MHVVVVRHCCCLILLSRLMNAELVDASLTIQTTQLGRAPLWQRPPSLPLAAREPWAQFCVCGTMQTVIAL